MPAATKSSPPVTTPDLTDAAAILQARETLQRILRGLRTTPDPRLGAAFGLLEAEQADAIARDSLKQPSPRSK